LRTNRPQAVQPGEPLAGNTVGGAGGLAMIGLGVTVAVTGRTDWITP
jgi:hypothetical protein